LLSSPSDISGVPAVLYSEIFPDKPSGIRGEVTGGKNLNLGNRKTATGSPGVVSL